VAEALVIYAAVVPPGGEQHDAPPAGGTGGSWDDQLKRWLADQWAEQGKKLAAWWAEQQRAIDQWIAEQGKQAERAATEYAEAKSKELAKQVCGAGFIPPLVFVAVCWAEHRRRR
jgi:hypothetical protein